MGKLERSRDFSDPGLAKARIEHMLASLSARWISKMQQAELIRVLNQEPSQVDFGGFLRLMKALETMVSDSYEECVDDLLRLVMDAAIPGSALQSPQGSPRFQSMRQHSST